VVSKRGNDQLMDPERGRPTERNAEVGSLSPSATLENARATAPALA
jgi:hypothetical protein